MQNHILRVFMLLLGLSATLGNIFVLLWRHKIKAKNNVQTVQSIFVGNLAISDLLMGIYMLLLSVTDAYYGEEFYKISDDWRVSVPCKVASVLAILSSETSLFLLTLITIDRYMILVFPFNPKHFRKLSAIIAVSGIWVFTITLSLTASVLADSNSDFYELSDVCIGLPLNRRHTDFEKETVSSGISDIDRLLKFFVPLSSKTFEYFSLIVFLGLNFFLTTAITILYVIIFSRVRKTRRAAQQSPRIKEEIIIALRMTTVTMTNCFCWLPITFLGILSQFELISIPLEMYVWSVVFILPINASLNPYLYTVSLVYGSGTCCRNCRKEVQTEAKSEIELSSIFHTTRLRPKPNK